MPDPKYQCYDSSGTLLAKYNAESPEIVARMYLSTIKKKTGGETVYVMDKSGEKIQITGYTYLRVELEKPIEETIYDNVRKKEFKVVYRYDSSIEKIDVDDSILLKILGLK